MSNAASEAAAGLAPELAADLVRLVPDVQGEDNLAAELGDLAVGAEPEVPSSPAQSAAPAEVQEPDEEFVLPSFSYIDEDEEDEPDFDVTADAEPDEETFDEYEDPDRLRAENAKLKKQLAHTQEQSAKQRLAQWRGKYKGMYPLANVDEIDATSRRAFERAAVKSHNANYKLLEPHLTKLQEAAQKIGGAARQDARADAVAAYGKPTAGPGIVPLEQSASTEELMAARKSGQLHKVLAVLMRGTNG